jgi:hypothetical protein
MSPRLVGIPRENSAVGCSYYQVNQFPSPACPLRSAASLYGRDPVFDQNSDHIYALQRSELLGSKTCCYSESIDG